jgi:hypothetical protein
VRGDYELTIETIPSISTKAAIVQNTQHISVSAIIFIMYTQSQQIVNQIIEILGIKKTKSG